MPGKVFLSVGSKPTEQQEVFIQAIEQNLQANGFTPQTVGRTYFTSQQPLKAIDELMRQCIGTVIIAYERLHIGEGVERRGSPREQALQAVNLPTVWNQIEAAMAYTLGHPLMVLVENSIKIEGLLEGRYDWYVQSVDLDRAALQEPQYIQVFADWKRRCEEYQRQHELGETIASTTVPLHAQANVDHERLIALSQILKTRFSETDLRELCFYLSLDYEALAGVDKTAKAIELLSLAQRTRRLDKLISAGQQLRPDIDWPVN